MPVVRSLTRFCLAVALSSAAVIAVTPSPDAAPAPTVTYCWEDEIRAIFASGPNGRTDSMCVHTESLSPGARNEITRRATAWKSCTTDAECAATDPR